MPTASPSTTGLALYFPAPHSFTGEDVLELQAHGGPVVLQLLLARCLEAAAETDPTRGQPRLPGLRVAQPGEFTERAFLNDKIDLAQAEAIADLIDASTEAAARSASRSLSGAFSRRDPRLRDALIHLRMLVEATLDFPEEEIDFLRQADAQGQLDRLQPRWRGAGPCAPGRVAARRHQGGDCRPAQCRAKLAAERLAGAELAIVTPIAGTTRDVVQQTIQIEGVPLHVVDTAGLRDSHLPGVDEVEQIGIERAWGQIESADAVLFLHDLTRLDAPEYRAEDDRITLGLAEKVAKNVPVVHVWNKCDAAGAAPAPADGLVLSAKAGTGLEVLRRRLLELAGWQGATEGLYIARERHVQALRRVRAHLDQAQAQLSARVPLLDLLAEELRLAQNALNDITGEFTPDDLLGVIFSRFCIGK
jgi:tRNA modification GTPase